MQWMDEFDASDIEPGEADLCHTAIPALAGPKLERPRNGKLYLFEQKTPASLRNHRGGSQVFTVN